MSDDPQERRYVRKNDYYGGDLYVVLPRDEWDDGTLNDRGVDDAGQIVWHAWGDYGRIAIALDEGECRKLAAALLEVADIWKGSDLEGEGE